MSIHVIKINKEEVTCEHEKIIKSMKTIAGKLKDLFNEELDKIKFEGTTKKDEVREKVQLAINVLRVLTHGVFTSAIIHNESRLLVFNEFCKDLQERFIEDCKDNNEDEESLKAKLELINALSSLMDKITEMEKKDKE